MAPVVHSYATVADRHIAGGSLPELPGAGNLLGTFAVGSCIDESGSCRRAVIDSWRRVPLHSGRSRDTLPNSWFEETPPGRLVAIPVYRCCVANQLGSSTKKSAAEGAFSGVFKTLKAR